MFVFYHLCILFLFLVYLKNIMVNKIVSHLIFATLTMFPPRLLSPSSPQAIHLPGRSLVDLEEAVLGSSYFLPSSMY